MKILENKAYHIILSCHLTPVFTDHLLNFFTESGTIFFFMSISAFHLPLFNVTLSVFYHPLSRPAHCLFVCLSHGF